VQTNVANIAASTAAAPPVFAFAPAASPGPSTLSSQMYEMQMQRRYGIGRYGRPGPPPPVTPAQPVPVTAVSAPQRKGPETILDERPFRVTMYLEVVRLTQRAGSKSAK